MSTAKHTIAGGWEPYGVSYARTKMPNPHGEERDTTIAIVRSLAKRHKDCQEKCICELVFLKNPIRGYAYKHPNDRDNPNLGRKLALFKAIGKDFGYPIRCNTCSTETKTYREAKPHLRGRHDIEHVHRTR